jgi:hypothetical protein
MSGLPPVSDRIADIAGELSLSYEVVSYPVWRSHDSGAMFIGWAIVAALPRR